MQTHLYFKRCQMFFVDFLSFIINGSLIWKFCNINPLRVLCDIQKRFWFIMMFIEVHLLSEHPSTYARRRHGLDTKIWLDGWKIPNQQQFVQLKKAYTFISKGSTYSFVNQQKAPAPCTKHWCHKGLMNSQLKYIDILELRLQFGGADS